MTKSAHPVLLSIPYTLFQDFPPSLELYIPLSSLSPQRAPKTPTQMLSEFLGSIIIEEILSDFGKPMLVQFNPPSVDLYIPSPAETLFLVQVSPVPTQITLSGLFGSILTHPID